MMVTHKTVGRSIYILKFYTCSLAELGNEVNNIKFLETIAFYVGLTSYNTIPIGSTVLFNEALLNQGNG